MATTFPTTIDSFTNITNPTTTTLETDVGGRTHSEFHNDYNDAIEAIEAKIGADGSAVTSSHTYKIETLETADAQNVKLSWNQTIAGNKTCSGTTTLSGSVVGIPWITGEIKIWTTGTAPTNWLICDGSAISRTTYATLFGVIGTVYGVGDGSTTFNIPNLKGKVVVGFNSAETEFDALGETGGEKTHLLTGAESGVPAHTHLLPIYSGGGGSAGLQQTEANNTANGQFTSSANTPANASTAHNNLQPYMALNYIIAI